MTEVVIFYFGNIFVIFATMKDESHLKTSKSVFFIPIVYVVGIWLIYWVEIYFNWSSIPEEKISKVNKSIHTNF